VQAAHGSFSWSGVGSQPIGLELQTNGLVRFTGAVADINAWSSQILFTPDLNFNGLMNVDWRLSDNEPTPLAAIRQSQLNVSAVNDSPVWQSAATPVVNQGESIVIGQSSSNATDIEDLSSGLIYKIVALPVHGLLTLNGVGLNLADSFTQADVDSGRISYRNDGGSATNDSVKFEVSDSQGAKTATQTLTLSVALRPVLVITTPPTPTPTASSSTPATVEIATGGPDVKDVAGGGDGGVAGVPGSVAPSIVTPSTSNSQRVAPRSNQSSTSSAPSSGDVSGATLSNASSQSSGSQLSSVAADLSAKQGPAATSGNSVRQDAGVLTNFMRIRTEAENLQYSGLIRAALQDQSFFDDVQKSKDDSNQSIKFDRNVVATSSALSASLSIGYVIWLVRGGALMSSLLASIPAWRMMDPLPILGTMGGNGSDQDDDESLGSMIDKAKAKKLAAQGEALEVAPAI
jgi:large repetitive protein